MVDRVIAYDGAIPQTTDILETNKFGMLGLAFASRAILGSSTEVHGLGIAPTSPTASLNVTISPGSIYQLDETDATAYGDLGVDASTIYKQGINYNTVTLTVTPPSTSGYSQNYLVQVALDDIDAGSETLSYFNATNPAAPWSGPNNSGMSQFTQRTCQCIIALKAGVAATSGTQTTPAPDAGFTGLYSITVVNGATQITSSNITTLSTAPFFPTLPAVPSDVQTNKWVYAVDTSAGGVPIQTNSTTSTSSAVLHFASVPSWITPGMTVFDLTSGSAITGLQTVLSSTVSTVTLSANVNGAVGSGDLIAFSNNAITAAISPVPAALVAGMSVRVKLSSTNTAVTTFNLNSLGAVAVHRANGAVLAAGDLNANMIVDLCYDGTAWQVVNFEGFTSGTTNNNTNTINIPYTNDASTTINVVTANPTPSLGSYAAGYTIEVKIANTNAGPSTLNVSGLGAVTIFNSSGNTLLPGQLVAGVVALFVYNGTAFNLINTGSLVLQANRNWYVNASTGSDTLYDGTSATVSGTHGPFATIQHAVSVTQLYNMNGFSQTINVANGAYTGQVLCGNCNGTGTVFIIGNTTTPSSCTLTTTAAPNIQSAFVVQGNNANYNISGFRVSVGNGTNSGDAGIGSYATNGGNLSLSYMQYGSCPAYHIAAGAGGNVGFSGHMWIEGGGNSGCFVSSESNSTIQAGGSCEVIILGAVNFAFQFCQAISNGTVGWNSAILNETLVSGVKYGCSLNGVIDTNGRGANFFPGTIAGFTQYGGQYI